MWARRRERVCWVRRRVACAVCCDCCGCGCDYRLGGAAGGEDEQEGCGRSEWEGWEGLVCLLGNNGLRSARYEKRSESRIEE